jgi:septal ring factor EnvC (AmiA/AmiB activator)
MGKKSQKQFVLTMVLILIALTAGCKDQNLSNTKKTRLIAVENNQLRKDLAQRDKEIEGQKELLVKCEQEKKDIEGQVQNTINELSAANFQDFEKITKLEEENNDLKAQIESLKKQESNSPPEPAK